MSDTKPQIQEAQTAPNKINGEKTEGMRELEFFKRIINKKSISDIFVLKSSIS